MLCTVLLVVLITVGSVHCESSCPACNCQFSNIQLLTGLIAGIVNDTAKTLHYQFGKLGVLFVHAFTGRSYTLGLAIWTPVELTFVGALNFDTASTFHFQIPDIIPQTAKEFLLYAYLACGRADGLRDSDIVFYVEHDGLRFEKFLYLRSFPQEAWNTNSDNMWFPMPADRQIHANVEVVIPRYCFARLYVIGYR